MASLGASRLDSAFREAAVAAAMLCRMGSGSRAPVLLLARSRRTRCGLRAVLHGWPCAPAALIARRGCGREPLGRQGLSGRPPARPRHALGGDDRYQHPEDQREHGQRRRERASHRDRQATRRSHWCLRLIVSAIDDVLPRWVYSTIREMSVRPRRGSRSLRKRTREYGRCPARTGDLLLVRREQLLRSTAACG